MDAKRPRGMPILDERPRFNRWVAAVVVAYLALGVAVGFWIGR